MEFDVSFYLVGALAVFILGLSKGGFAGVGTISTPLLALVIGPITAAGIILPILIVQDIVAMLMFRRTYSRPILLTMIPGAALGIVIAFAFAARVPPWGVEIALGVVSLFFAIQQLRVQFGGAEAPPQESALGRSLGVLSGMGSGFTSMIAHAGSPPFQFYVMPKRLDRDMYVGTSVMFFAAVNAMKVPAFYALGQLSLGQLKTSLVFVPIGLASSWLGVRLVRMIDVRRFNIAITVILLLVALTLIGQGVIGFRNAP